MIGGRSSRALAWPRVRVSWLAAAVLLGGCAFGPNKPKPAPLEPIARPISGGVVWQQRVGRIDFPLAIAVNGPVVTAAGGDGTVTALQSENGRELWRVNLGTPLSAGVGSDGRRAAVVTRNGDLVLIEGGRVQWRKPVGVRVHTEPLVAGERVFVLAGDRSVQAFDAIDGRRLWEVRRSGDPLTLAQRGVVTAYQDNLLVGQGPRLVALDPNDGQMRWEVSLATPRGANEIDRLADLVGPAVRAGDRVCARAFQAAVACVNVQRGALGWTRSFGGTDGIAADEQLVAAADASDRLSGWNAASGEVVWSSEKLMYRELGSPVMVGDWVAAGDRAGTVHFLAKQSGAPVLRLTTDGSGVVGQPVLAGGLLIVATRTGGLFALRATAAGR